MLDFPENIKELLKKSDTHKRFRLAFKGFAIENDRIISESLQLKQSLFSGDGLVFGACESSELQITVVNVLENISGKEFSLSFFVENYEIPLGKYTVQSVKRESDRRRRKIIAYDRMQWFKKDVSEWYQGLSFPMTLKMFRNSFCQYIGIEQEESHLLFDSMEIKKNIDPSKISGIEVLRAICEINGCFASINYDGKVKYIRLPHTGLYPSESLYPEENLYPSELGTAGSSIERIFTYKQPMTYEDYLVESITGVSIYSEDGTLGASVGKEYNTYIIQGDFLTYGKTPVELLNIANSLLPLLNRRAYRPVNVDCQFMPWLEIGDPIQIFARDDVVETYIINRTITGCQVMRDRISSSGNKVRENKNSLHEKLIQSEHKMVSANMTAEKVYVVLEDFKQDTMAKLEVTDKSITAEVNRATEAEGDLSSLIAVNAEEIELKVSKGQISSVISQESGGIHFSSNRFSWQSDRSSLAADGTLTCDGIQAKNGSFAGTINGSRINGSTISGTTISGTTITGAEIESPNISGGTLTDVDLRSANLKSADSFRVTYLTPGAISCGDAKAAESDFTIVIWKYYFGKSDKRLKTNIIPLREETGLSVIRELNPVSFLWRKFNSPALGFIAQEVKEVADKHNLSEYCYCKNKDGYYSIPYQNYIGIMVSAIQNLKQRIDALKENKHESIDI